MASPWAHGYFRPLVSFDAALGAGNIRDSTGWPCNNVSFSFLHLTEYHSNHFCLQFAWYIFEPKVTDDNELPLRELGTRGPTGTEGREGRNGADRFHGGEGPARRHGRSRVSWHARNSRPAGAGGRLRGARATRVQRDRRVRRAAGHPRSDGAEGAGGR